MYDVIILGAGIIGCQNAYDLSHYDLKVLVLEKNHEILNEVSSSNSGIIHTGYDPEEGTLKAKLNTIGAQRYPELCERLHVERQVVGSMVVATTMEECENLIPLMVNAKNRNIPYHHLNKEQAKSEEPNLSNDVVEALYFPTTAIIMPWEMGYALMDFAVLNGVELKTHEPVTQVIHHDHSIEIVTPLSSYHTKMVINCTGLYGDTVAHLHDEKHNFTLKYHRGQYQVTDRNTASYLNHVIFPVPSSKGKGVLAIKTTEGNLLLGPTSEMIEDPSDFSTTVEGQREIDQKIQRILTPLPKSKMIRQFSGVRPKSTTGDFVLNEKGGWINAIGIDSPGLASSPAISLYILETFISPKLKLTKKESVKELPLPILRRLEDDASWSKKIKLNPTYGKVVCICEHISEQEIIDAMHRPVPALSIKAIKRRVRPGSGRCQGGFCESQIVALIAQELNCSVEEVRYDESPFLEDINP